jgi:hypothetical protein
MAGDQHHGHEKTGSMTRSPMFGRNDPRRTLLDDHGSEDGG